MSVRAKFINSVVLVALALVAWTFTRPPAESPLVPLQLATPPAASASSPPVELPEPAAATEKPVTTQTNRSESLLVESAGPEALHERTLIGTKWEREQLALEFGADGKLLIGGRE